MSCAFTGWQTTNNPPCGISSTDQGEIEHTDGTTTSTHNYNDDDDFDFTDESFLGDTSSPTIFAILGGGITLAVILLVYACYTFCIRNCRWQQARNLATVAVPPQISGRVNDMMQLVNQQWIQTAKAQHWTTTAARAAGTEILLMFINSHRHRQYRINNWQALEHDEVNGRKAVCVRAYIASGSTQALSAVKFATRSISIPLLP